MASVKRQIFIDVPLEAVFAFVADTPKLVGVWPGLLAVRNWSRDENGLASFDFEYQMAGFKFSGQNRDAEYVHNQRIVTKSTSGLENTITWEFFREEEGTRVNFEGEYRVPIPLLGRIAENIIVSLNELDVDVLLTNLKRQLELRVLSSS